MVELTAFGKELRKIRIDRGEVLKDMADRLKVSSSFLSAVEIGRKNAPENWCSIIEQSYELSHEEGKKLQRLAKESVTSVKVPLYGSGEQKRQAALVFARDFSAMSEETAEKFIDFMKQERKK